MTSWSKVIIKRNDVSTYKETRKEGEIGIQSSCIYRKCVLVTCVLLTLASYVPYYLIHPLT